MRSTLDAGTPIHPAGTDVHLDLRRGAAHDAARELTAALQEDLVRPGCQRQGAKGEKERASPHRTSSLCAFSPPSVSGKGHPAWASGFVATLSSLVRPRMGAGRTGRK
jgi:hypothetical protein